MGRVRSHSSRHHHSGGGGSHVHIMINPFMGNPNVITLNWNHTDWVLKSLSCSIKVACLKSRKCITKNAGMIMMEMRIRRQMFGCSTLSLKFIWSFRAWSSAITLFAGAGSYPSICILMKPGSFSSNPWIVRLSKPASSILLGSLFICWGTTNLACLRWWIIKRW